MNIKDLLKDAYKEGMTVDEINAALAGVEIPADNSAEIERLKTALSKSNTEAADYKKQLRDKMSAEEQKAKDEAEKFADLQNKYDTLLKESTISKHKARLLGLGYEDKLASETAEAIANGEMDKVFENQKKHQEAMDKKIRDEVLKGTPRPTGGSGKDKSAEDILKIADSVERQTAIAENIDLFQ